MTRVEIEMLRSERGQDVTEQGTAARQQWYLGGKTYRVGQGLARTFIAMGAAKTVESAEAPVEQKPRRKKALGAAPENKGA